MIPLQIEVNLGPGTTPEEQAMAEAAIACGPLSIAALYGLRDRFPDATDAHVELMVRLFVKATAVAMISYLDKRAAHDFLLRLADDYRDLTEAVNAAKVDGPAVDLDGMSVRKERRE